MIRGLHHVGINCRDIDRMIRFYQDAFGFELVGEFDWANEPKLDTIVDVPRSAARGAMMRSGTVYFELFQYLAPATTDNEPARPFTKGYTHFCIDTDDIEADWERLTAAGMDFRGRHWVDMGHVRTLYGYDPEGNLIEVQQCMPGNGMELKDVGIG